jgi:hypothetical protein
MGVRYGDKSRQALLNDLISQNRKAIQTILAEYHFPLLTIPEKKPRKDDD